MTVSWIEWGKSAGELARHLGEAFGVGLQMRFHGGEVMLLGDATCHEWPYYRLADGAEYWSPPQTNGCGCCAGDEFREHDIVTEYRIWPVNAEAAKP